MQHSRWDVIENAYLGIFSFSQFVMWNDLRNNLEELSKNRVVSSLMQGKLTWEPEKIETSLDASVEKEVLVPIPADASQLKAIHSAGLGKSFVLHGPPGTGKSQTITNMVAYALSQGKRVLFVAEKMAALTVVQRRLEKIGLGPFCLELHSNKSSKKDVLNQLEQALQAGKRKNVQDFENRKSRLAALREELADYARELHRQYPCGFSLYEMIERFETLPHDAKMLEVSSERILSMNRNELSDVLEIVTRFISQVQALGSPLTHPFRAVSLSKYSQQFREEYTPRLEEFLVSIEKLKETAISFSERYSEKAPVSRSSWENISLLAEKMPPLFRLPQSWRERGNLPQLCDKLEHINHLNSYINEKREDLQKKYTESLLEFDAESMKKEWDEFYILWPETLKVEKLPKKWLENVKLEDEFTRLLPSVSFGAQLMQKAAELRKNWKDAFFQQDGEALLREWRGIFGTSRRNSGVSSSSADSGVPETSFPSNSSVSSVSSNFQEHSKSRGPRAVDVIPDSWWETDDFEKFLQDVLLLCEIGVKWEEHTKILRETWTADFLKQSADELQVRWNRVHSSNFLFRPIRRSFFVSHLKVWAKKTLTDPVITEALDILAAREEEDVKMNCLLENIRSKLSSFRSADSYRWAVLSERCRLIQEHPEEVKQKLLETAFLKKVSSWCVLPEAFSLLPQAFETLIQFQKDSKTLEIFLSENEVFLSDYAGSGDFPWHKVEADCKTVLENYAEYSWYVKTLPLKKAFNQKMHRAFPKEPLPPRMKISSIFEELCQFQKAGNEFSQLRDELSSCLADFGFGPSLDAAVQNARNGWKPFSGQLAELAAKILKVSSPQDVENYLRPLYEAWKQFEEKRCRVFIFFEN